MSGRLSSHDSVFQYWERPEQPMHVAECMVYDSHITAPEVIGMIEERLHLLPRYTQRIIGVPLGIAHPTWVDDPNFNLADHVDERQIPAPGDDRTMSAYVGELYCELLPRDRPLWHINVLQGYANGGTILFIKLHHSMVDGVSSVELIDLLHSTERGKKPPQAKVTRPQAAPLPGGLRRFGDALVDNTKQALRNTGELVEMLRPSGLPYQATRITNFTRALATAVPKLVKPLSPTPFNAPIANRRDFSWVEIPFEEVKEVRRALGGTVNDVVLGVLSGALGRYMRRHGVDTTGRELLTMCPVSVRSQDQAGTFGNQISMIWSPLYVDQSDPVRRLTDQRQAMEKLKAGGQADGMFEFIKLADWIPAPMFKALWKVWPKGYFPLHITSTNVPGPPAPLYLGEHELLQWLPFGVQWTNNGLFLCTLSYRGRLILGPVGCPGVVDDVWDFADDLDAAFRELHTAATQSIATPPARPERRSATKSAPKRAAAKKSAPRAKKASPARKTTGAATDALGATGQAAEPQPTPSRATPPEEQLPGATGLISVPSAAVAD